MSYTVGSIEDYENILEEEEEEKMKKDEKKDKPQFDYGDILLVKFRDNSYANNHWSGEEDIDDAWEQANNSYLYCVGFLVKENDDFIMLVQVFDDLLDTAYLHSFIIPKGTIVEIHKLNKEEK